MSGGIEYGYRKASWIKRVMRQSAVPRPMSWLYARTLHHIDRGQRHNPAWYHNLQAYPRASVFVDGASRDVVARELMGDERERWYARGIGIYPGWRHYRKRAEPRQIPVVELPRPPRRQLDRAVSKLPESATWARAVSRGKGPRGSFSFA